MQSEERMSVLIKLLTRWRSPYRIGSRLTENIWNNKHLWHLNKVTVIKLRSGQWTDISSKYSWIMSTWKNVQHFYLLDECKSKLHIVYNSNQNGYRQRITDTGKNMGKKEPYSCWWEYKSQPIWKLVQRFLKFKAAPIWSTVTPFTLPNYGLSLVPVNRGTGK